MGGAVKVRFAQVDDSDELVEMARVNSETRPNLRFNETRTRAAIAGYLLNAQPTMWVAEKDGELFGLLVADFYPYRYFDGLFTTQ
ncbi:hypothetical protein MACH17_01620 [Phaeobacter inhibens]|uniref:hypothetical protein n=1 Tax=Phaeobacter inhibens TaxID=221822 RepID=UPI002751F4B0|nr:hypothetical protein [Phaeobacter inhibens]GLO68645.1 hypothetical protein MACH17_01620 [Phaeobacter inhibens]